MPGYTGTLVPPWYDAPDTSLAGLLVAAFFYGASVAVAAFVSAKAVRRSSKRWRHNGRAKVYIAMIWAVIVTCMITSLCIWLFLLGIIPPSFWYFFGMRTWADGDLCLGCKTQCLMQILANRLSLIMYNPSRERRLKVGLLMALGLINVSVFVVWIPARLQMSPEWVFANEVWDRTEKAIYAVIDMALNIYFMWLVRTKLVAGGLKEYRVLWKYNAAMACLSISLDVMLIGMMSLPDDAVYVQVHPLVYLTKLNIEMNMAELIGKVSG
ncbi:hypothetical protein VTJ83DRAFT_4482 [Remersonia thermophila]|uniref:Uncharacterized protein n=1 Tax=Remersonia thermophila TaxID=72144 RepID=A0ABR4DA22_9PEZI